MTDLNTLAGRVLSRSTPNPKTGCWICSYSSPGGGTTPHLSDGKRHVRADAIMYEFSGGKLPSGWILLHTCNEPTCVNPDHMRTAMRPKATPTQKTFTADDVNEKIRQLRSSSAVSEKT